jgi:aerobic carbon-monoxide dehydrogenase medium subunit
MTTALETDEVLVAIHIQRPKPSVQFRYRKIRHPASGYAVVGITVAVGLKDSVVDDAVIGVTGATARAFAADAASAFLISKSLSSRNMLPRGVSRHMTTDTAYRELAAFGG